MQVMEAVPFRRAASTAPGTEMVKMSKSLLGRLPMAVKLGVPVAAGLLAAACGSAAGSTAGGSTAAGKRPAADRVNHGDSDRVPRWFSGIVPDQFVRTRRIPVGQGQHGHVRLLGRVRRGVAARDDRAPRNRRRQREGR